MAMQRPHIHDGYTDRPAVVATPTTTVVRPAFGLVQTFCLALGIFFVVLGAVGLARAGLSSMTSPRVQVGAFSMTPLLALIHLAIGLVGLAGATSRVSGRGFCLFLGPVAIAAGIIAFIQPVRELGYNRADAVAYVVVGALALIGAMMTPVAAIEEPVL